MVKTKKPSGGFTIVELLIVVVVIAVLAAIVTVSYNAISTQAKVTLLKSDLESGAKQLLAAKVDSGTETLPANANGLAKSNRTSFDYNASGASFCLAATSADLVGRTFYIREDGVIQEGSCPPFPLTDGVVMQTVTTANCPTDRIRAVDARDNHTYWIQKMADGKCWMLTNLAYDGGGTNTYNDVRTLYTGTVTPYTVPKYFISASGSNVTVEPTNPSTSTNAGATNTQYGYLYNYCAAHGGQATSACSQGTLPDINTAISICPAGWRVPSGNGGHYGALNSAVNGGSTTSDAGLLSTWLLQYSGFSLSSGTFSAQGLVGDFWSATNTGNGNQAYTVRMRSNLINTAQAIDKTTGAAVRCIAV